MPDNCSFPDDGSSTHTQDRGNDLGRLKVIFCAQFLTGRIAQMIHFWDKSVKLTVPCT